MWRCSPIRASRAITRPRPQNFFILHEGPIGVLGGNNLVEMSYGDLQGDGTRDSDRHRRLARLYRQVLGDRRHSRPGRGRQRALLLTARAPAIQDVYQTNFVNQNAVVVPAGGTAEHTSLAFAGAKVESIIDSYEQDYGIDRLELLIDWGWFHFITKPMFYLIRLLYELLGNFGLAILAVTVIVKAIFFPLANSSYASMATMRRVQPEMKAIQERHKDDRAAQQQAMMELYKKEKINPLSGCWPILIQIPVFFALYKVLFVTIEMRHAPFFGWIQDLAAPDPTTIFTLFGLLP